MEIGGCVIDGKDHFLSSDDKSDNDFDDNSDSCGDNDCRSSLRE